MYEGEIEKPVPQAENVNNPSIDNSEKNGIINSGGKIISAGGKVTEKNFTKALEYENQAKAFYDACVRNGDDDVRIISQNTGFKYEDVLSIKKHIMEESHLFNNGSVAKFDPNIDIALAWQRLIENRATDTDILLLNHELRELRFIQKNGSTYEVAHEFANKKYDWQSAIDSITDNDNLNPELLK